MINWFSPLVYFLEILSLYYPTYYYIIINPVQFKICMWWNYCYGKRKKKHNANGIQKWLAHGSAEDVYKTTVIETFSFPTPDADILMQKVLFLYEAVHTTM